MLTVDDSLQTNLVYGHKILKKTKQEKVLVVILDNKLNFATHLLNITKNTNKKFNASMRAQKYMTTYQKTSFFIKSRFTYCPKLLKTFPSQNKQYT